MIDLELRNFSSIFESASSGSCLSFEVEKRFDIGPYGFRYGLLKLRNTAVV